MSAKSLRRPAIRLATRAELERSLPVALVRASHPRQALVTAAAVAVAAAFAGRSFAQVLIVFATVLTGQALLGWTNDLVDVQRDRRHGRQDKPLAQEHLDHGQLGFALACAVLLVVPLSLMNGVTAGAVHLVLVVLGVFSNIGALRGTVFSFVPWVLGFALWPAFLSFGSAPYTNDGSAPGVVITVLAGLLGLGVHVLVSLRQLVTDNEDKFKHLPLLLALRTGAPRLLVGTAVYLAVVSLAIVVTGLTLGVAR